MRLSPLGRPRNHTLSDLIARIENNKKRAFRSKILIEIDLLLTLTLTPDVTVCPD